MSAHLKTTDEYESRWSASPRMNNHQSQGYQRLDGGDPNTGDGISDSKPRNKNISCSPGRLFGKNKKHTSEVTLPVSVQVSEVKSKKLGKTHPLFNFGDPKNSKKAMAKPEFIRYVEYLKEGGKWDTEADKFVMHFK